MEIWSFLDIDQTKDISKIKRAYAKKLKIYHPEDDPEGYQKLREAYDYAIKYAKNSSDSTKFKGEISIDISKTNSLKVDKFENSIALKNIEFMSEVENLYNDFFSRIKIENWRKLLDNEVIWNVFNKPTIDIMMIKFLEAHHYLPKDIWIFLESNFNLCEIGPSIDYVYNHDFYLYIKKQITDASPKDYSFFKYKEGVEYEKFLEYRENAENDFAENNISSAENNINLAKDIYSEDPYLLCLEGKLFLKDNNVIDAIDTFTKVLDINIHDLEAVYYRATAYYEANKISDFENDYKAFYSKLPNESEILIHIVKSYLKIGNLEKAKEWCQELNKLDIKTNQVKGLIAQTYAKLRDRAIKELQKNPSDKNLKYNLTLINHEIRNMGKQKISNFPINIALKIYYKKGKIFKTIIGLILLYVFAVFAIAAGPISIIYLVYFIVSKIYKSRRSSY